MAGTIPLSMTQQLDQFGAPLAGGHLYLIQAGTVSTPQNGYQDSALTLPWPNPIILSASGRIPQFFLADGSIKIRLTDVNGVEILVADGLIVTGASSGGGGGSPVDATTVLATGDLKVKYGTGVLSGFVRCNARTIGSATSGASERANSDTQALFEYLWNADINLTVSTGRGASSAADWAANKTIALPDWRGRALAGLDDMGNTAAGRLTVSYFGPSSTALGASGGNQASGLSMSNLPATPAPVSATVASQGSGQITTGGGALAPLTVGLGAATTAVVAGGGVNVYTADKFALINTPVLATTNTLNLGSGTSFATVSPMMLATVYLKL